MRRVLVTGANGFIGAALTPALRSAGFEAITAGRSEGCDHRVAPLGPGADWSGALIGVDAVVHLAGPAHARYPAEVLHRAIADGAARLAAQACAAGVRQFVFMSSIKACAEESATPLREADAPRPADDYGRAKLAAEQAVMAELGSAATILRPPLVYASNAKANFARLLRLASSPAPLPLANIDNRRSLIALTTLVDALLAALRDPGRAHGVFHLADEPALSSGEIVSLLRQGMGRAPNLFALPRGLQNLLPAQLRRSLAVDAGKFRTAFPDFTPGDARAGLMACAARWRAGA